MPTAPAHVIDSVDPVLRRLGLGRLRWPTATLAVGRNDNWIGDTTTGRRVFVKKVTGQDAEVVRRMRRTEAFYRSRSAAGRQDCLRTAELLGQDERAGVQVFSCVDDASDGSRLAVDQRFGADLGRRAGMAIATVHGGEPSLLRVLAQSLPAEPPADLLGGLSLEIFYDSSFAQLEVWRLIQRDRSVVDGLAALERPVAEELLAPVHGDLRLDQFLLAGGQLYVTDWEEFQLADPARDVGSFLGEWIYHSVVAFLAERGRRGAGRPVPVPNIVLSPNWAAYGRAREVVGAFWAGYRSIRRILDPEFADRATLFAGWHLIERLLMDTMVKPRLDGAGHALFRVAGTILRAPGRFAPVLGLADSPC